MELKNPVQLREIAGEESVEHARGDKTSELRSEARHATRHPAGTK
jgi:hypothetical protein